MSYSIALNFEDGVSRFITCKSGETVLDAAYRQKINLPMDCSDGVCGTCKGHCEQGAFDLGDEYLEEALSEEEYCRGQGADLPDGAELRLRHSGAGGLDAVQDPGR